MDINTLRTFIEVYRTRHFGKAADNLFVTQSTVSTRIRQLEEELGVSLFERDRNNIQLTSFGKRFLRHAESIITIWNRAKIDITIKDEKNIPIVIGGVPSLWDIYLGKLLLTVKKKYSNLSVIAEALSTETIIRQLIDHTIDLGFTYDFPQLSEIAVRDFLAFELILVSSYKNISMANVMDADYIYVDWGASFSNQHAKYFPDAPIPKMRINLGRIAREFIMENGGSAYLPEPMVRNDLVKERLFRVNDAPSINRKSFALYYEDSDRLDIVEKLMSLKNMKY